MAKNFEKLIFGGLREKHAVQRGIWVPTQHSLWDQGKPWSSCDWSIFHVLLVSCLVSWGGPNIEPRSDHYKTPFLVARFLLSRIIATTERYCCAYALLWECCCIATDTCRLVLLRIGYRCLQPVGGFDGRLPQELDNFESLYKCIQRTCTVFWTVIM
jgi:hypothetical protein